MGGLGANAGSLVLILRGESREKSAPFKKIGVRKTRRLERFPINPYHIRRP